MAGLFDYQSPENMRAARLQPLLVSGAQMGQQQLLSQLVSQMSNAGANIGATGAGMLGLQLPEEARQQQVQSIMQGVDLNSPEGLMGAAKKFSAAGLTKEAELASDRANKVSDSAYVQGQRDNETKAREAISAALVKNPNASSAELFAVAAPFSKNPESVIQSVVRKEEAAQTVLNKKQEVEDKNQAKLEQIKLQGELAAERARDAGQSRDNSDRIAAQARADTAAMFAGVRLQISADQKEAKKDAAAEIAAARVAAAQLARENKLLNKPKDVAELEAASVVLGKNLNNLDKYLVMVEGDQEKKIEPSVDFSYIGQLKAWGDSKTKSPTKATLQMASIKKAIAKQVELILQAANGTQTEGDAQRAKENILNALEGDSNSGIAQAIRELQEVQATTMQANSAYIKSRGYGNTETTTNTPKRPLSDFNK